MGREGKVKAVGVEVIEWQIDVDRCGQMCRQSGIQADTSSGYGDMDVEDSVAEWSKAIDLKSIILWMRRFKSCHCRFFKNKSFACVGSLQQQVGSLDGESVGMISGIGQRGRVVKAVAC